MTERERIEAEVEAFLWDRRHLDYIQTDRNHDLIVALLEREGLEVSAESLHAAYTALHDELDVHRPVMPAAPIPQPTIPQAPQTPVQELESEPRLHAVERRPGESAWMAAKRAYAEQQILAQRKARQQMRAEMQKVPTDAARLAAARDADNQYAKSMRPYGKGAALIKNGE